MAKATTAYLPIAKARGFRSFFGELKIIFCILVATSVTYLTQSFWNPKWERTPRETASLVLVGAIAGYWCIYPAIKDRDRR